MNTTQIKERISIVDFLSKYGIEPKYPPKSNEYRYISPIRSSDMDASFFVNDRNGIWFDHGMAQGGNIIDLALRLFETTSVHDVVQKISAMYDRNQLPSIRQYQSFNEPSIKQDPTYRIKEFKEIGNNKALSKYVEERGIGYDIANHLFKEIYYTVQPDPLKGTKDYFALSWANDSGYYEVRNPMFKGCLGSKDLSTFNISPSNYNQKIAIFEGILDYASWLQVNNRRKQAPAVILNSLAMLNKAAAIIKDYSNPYLFLDNDKSGREATISLKKQFVYAIDQSFIYQGYKDFNEWQCSLKAQRSISR